MGTIRERETGPPKLNAVQGVAKVACELAHGGREEKSIRFSRCLETRAEEGTVARKRANREGRDGIGMMEEGRVGLQGSICREYLGTYGRRMLDQLDHIGGSTQKTSTLRRPATSSPVAKCPQTPPDVAPSGTGARGLKLTECSASVISACVIAELLWPV